ncbi:MAG: hypothetical protein NT007_04115 [Candidatus Kapabacteria bacterium]|nr:hypothetical protein [Candidatus Kapabacteria bacterium]
MDIKKFLTVATVSTLIFTGASFLNSCTKMITEEQKVELNKLRKLESELTDDISKAKKDKAALEAELNSRKTEYNKCNEEREFIKSKLATFPDCWPGWKPEAPKQEDPK